MHRRMKSFFKAFNSDSHMEDFLPPPRMSLRFANDRSNSGNRVQVNSYAKRERATKARANSLNKANFDNNDVNLVQMMSVPILHDALLCYSQIDLSEECILLYDMIQIYKKTSTIERREIAHNIYTSFLLRDSKYEVNIQQSHKEKLEEILKEEQELSTDIFFDIETEMLNNIRDIYLRFSSTSVYEDSVQTSDIRRGMLN